MRSACLDVSPRDKHIRPEIMANIEHPVHDRLGRKLSKSHINDIENFWGIAKMRLSKFRGLNKGTFYLHLKETEFRFNNRHEDLYKLMLQMLRDDPLKLS
jgi:hypothetical protein